MKRVPSALDSRTRNSGSFKSLAARWTACATALLGLAAWPLDPARAQGWPAGVQAEYEVAYNGFSIGTFAFKAHAEQQTYTLTGNASISMLLGVIKWTSDIRSAGSLAPQAPKPALYAFDAHSGDRSAWTRVSFEAGAVSTVTHSPQSRPKTDTVPLREQHLRGVVDPLSAMLMMTQASASPCERRIPVFDGRERFDLVLSRKGEMRLGEQQGGHSGLAQVCQVRYVPIAGHIPDSDTRFMASNEGIEVVLRPVPGARLYVPYQITIPMPLGSATLVSKRVEITQAGKRIALLQ